jgi:hypothetical protein
MVKRFIGLAMLCLTTLVQGWNPCPQEIYSRGDWNDLGLLSEVVSWDGGFEYVHGVCGEYRLLQQTEGIYDTRMRIYEKSSEDIVIVFRPTQQTSQGGDIHVNRRLVPCSFINECQGLVNDRFQEAFLDLISKVPSSFWEEKVRHKNVLVAGHSLGGSLQLFMAFYLWKELETLPQMSFGLAGPFIGDSVFTDQYQKELKEKMGNTWWQVEAQNKYNSWDVDTTVEGYQVDSYPKLEIQQEVICRLSVDHLSDSYGMHDLRNYRTGLRGNQCD